MKTLIAIDPSKIGKKTSGTGVAIGKCYDKEKLWRINNFIVYGKNYETQAQYNEAIIKVLDTTKSNTTDMTVILEEYQDYNKAETKFQVNGTAEMIGVIKYWCLTNEVPIITRNASAMKRRLPDDIMQAYKWSGSDGAYCNIIRFDGTPVVYSTIETPGKHWYDAYRHLLMTIFLSKTGKDIMNEQKKNIK